MSEHWPDSEHVQGSRHIQVCLANRLFHPDFSGAGRRFRGYASKLLEHGVQYRVIADSTRRRSSAPSATPGSPVLSQGPASLEVHGVVDGALVNRVSYRTGTAEKRKRWLYFGMVQAASAFEPFHIEVVHFVSLTYHAIPALLKLKYRRMPCVLSQVMMPVLPSGLLRNLLHRAAWRTQFSLLDCIVANSSATAAELRRLGCRTRIEVISNGVELERFRPATSMERLEIRARLGLAAERRYVLFVGAIVRRKGLDLLIAAFNRLIEQVDDLDLLVVGPHGEDIRTFTAYRSYGQHIRQQISGTRIESRVHFVGEVDDAAEYFKAADVFALPSDREGMPNVLLEAFASGVASVITPFQGLDSQFGVAGENYVLADRNPEALAAHIGWLLSNPREAGRLGVAARRWAEANFALEDTIRRYGEIYRDLSGSTGARSTMATGAELAP